MKNIKIYYGISLFAAIMALLVGCQKQDPATIVQQRAQERWDLLINHQPVKAYDYLSPGYRATHTLDQYVAFIATARLRWKSVKIEGERCDPDACTVNLFVTSTIPGQLINAPQDIEHQAPVLEHWVLSEGQWYFLPDSKIQPATIPANAPPPAAAPANQTPPSPTQPDAASQSGH